MDFSNNISEQQLARPNRRATPYGEAASTEPKRPAKTQRLGIPRPKWVPRPSFQCASSSQTSLSSLQPVRKLGIKRPAFKSRQALASSSSRGPSQPPTAAAPCRGPNSTSGLSQQPTPPESPPKLLAPNLAAPEPKYRRFKTCFWPEALTQTIGQATSSRVSRLPGPMNPPPQLSWAQRQQIMPWLPKAFFGYQDIPINPGPAPFIPAPTPIPTAAPVPIPVQSGPQPVVDNADDPMGFLLLDRMLDDMLKEQVSAPAPVQMEMEMDVDTVDDPASLLPFLEEYKELDGGFWAFGK